MNVRMITKVDNNHSLGIVHVACFSGRKRFMSKERQFQLLFCCPNSFAARFEPFLEKIEIH